MFKLTISERYCTKIAKFKLHETCPPEHIVRLPRQSAAQHTTSKPAQDELAPFLRISMSSWGNRKRVTERYLLPSTANLLDSKLQTEAKNTQRALQGSQSVIAQMKEKECYRTHYSHRPA